MLLLLAAVAVKAFLWKKIVPSLLSLFYLPDKLHSYFQLLFIYFFSFCETSPINLRL